MGTFFSRRSLIANLVTLPVVGRLLPLSREAGSDLWPAGSGNRISKQEFFPLDKVDLYEDYLKQSTDLKRKQDRMKVFIAETLAALPIPANGKVVEFGTWNAGSFDELCRVFGADRCVGYDIFPKAERPNIFKKDTRELSVADDFPIAFGWNDTSDWYNSPQSKFAAAKFIARNLVDGGYYMDLKANRIPENVIFKGFSVVLEHKEISLYRKVSSNAEIIWRA